MFTCFSRQILFLTIYFSCAKLNLALAMKTFPGDLPKYSLQTDSKIRKLARSQKFDYTKLSKQIKYDVMMINSSKQLFKSIMNVLFFRDLKQGER